MGFCTYSMFCCALLCVDSSFAFILTGKRELVALLVSHDCCVALPRDTMGLCQFVIVVFPDYLQFL